MGSIKLRIKKIVPLSALEFINYMDQWLEKIKCYTDSAKYSLIEQLEKDGDKTRDIIENAISGEAQSLKDEFNEVAHQFEILKRDIYNLKLEVGKTTDTNRSRKILNTSIKKQMWDLAGVETARYVLEHMDKTRTFNTETELLTYAVGCAGNGLYLEFGVYSGKTINQIADIKTDCIIYGFDSFEGLPETWRTGYEQGEFSRSNLPEVRVNVELIEGWFENTLPDFVQEYSGDCAFIHVDCDLYSSTQTIFKWLGGRIKSGTVLLFDEYFNYPGWVKNEYKAFQEYVTEAGISYEYIGYVDSYEQVAVIIK